MALHGISIDNAVIREARAVAHPGANCGGFFSVNKLGSVMATVNNKVRATSYATGLPDMPKPAIVEVIPRNAVTGSEAPYPRILVVPRIMP
jgi:hypothetical protein